MVPLPNVLKAMLDQTRTFPDLVAMTNNQITGGRIRTFSVQDPTGWKMPSRAIVYHLVPGPSVRYYRIPVRSQPIQVEWYGPDLRLADELWRTWYAHFFPSLPNVAQGFIQANCAVIQIDQMGATLGAYEAITGWPRVVQTISVLYSEIPTNVVIASADIGAQAGIG